MPAPRAGLRPAPPDRAMPPEDERSRPASRARSRRRRGRGQRAVAYRRDTAPAGEVGRRRGRAAARRRRTSPEHGAQRGATGRARAGDPRQKTAARPRTSPDRNRGRSGGAASTRARACRQPGGGGWRVPGPVTRSRERRLRSLDARDPGRRWADGGACPAAVAITGLLGSVEGFNEDNAHSLSEPGQRYGNMG